MRVYEAIGETLKRLNVQATFGLMGDGNLRFMTHLADELGIPYYAARHEGGAVAMADGYARVTGRVGVCSVTQGPGVTNTLTAHTEARKASTPMLLLAGDTAARILRHNQDVDQTAIFKSIGVTVARVRSADTLMEAPSGLCGTSMATSPESPRQRLERLTVRESGPGSDRPHRAGHDPDAQPSRPARNPYHGPWSALSPTQPEMIGQGHP